ncbi:hypothetical protein PV327_011322, partial [Microctonus hyperodae]
DSLSSISYVSILLNNIVVYTFVHQKQVVFLFEFERKNPNIRTKLSCVFCNENSDENVNIFSEETFQKCKNIFRLQKSHNLKYSDVILPREYFDRGYHRKCYKAFTALKKNDYDAPKSKKIITSQCSSQSIEDSLQQSTSRPSTSACVENICEDICVDSAVENVHSEEYGPSTADAVVEDVVNVSSIGSIGGPLDASIENGAVTVSSTNLCIFCDKSHKTHRRKNQTLHRAQKEELEAVIEQKCNLENDEEERLR